MNNMRLGRYFEIARAGLTKPGRVAHPPTHLQVELTTACNLNCPACPRSACLGGGSPSHLTPERFLQIVDAMRPAKITLSGLGEPLLSPHLFELIRIAKRLGVAINTTTNGLFLTPDRCIELMQSGLDLLKVSLDAATPDTYRLMRGTNTFWHVLDGVRLLNEVKKQQHASTPALRFNYLVTQQNYREMAETVDLAEKLGVQAIYFQPLDLFGLEDRQPALVGALTAEALAHEIRRALSAEQGKQVRTNLRDFFQRLPEYWRKYQIQPDRKSQSGTHYSEARRLFPACLLPWFSAYITVTGDMRPCCSCWSAETTMGNVFESPFDAVWNGERYHKLRQAFRNGNRPFPVCETCVPKTLTALARYATLLPGFVASMQRRDLKHE